MHRQKKFMKWLIVFIFLMFILFTALSWLMYLGGWGNSSGTWDNLTWVIIETWSNLSWSSLSWNNLTWVLTTWEKLNTWNK